jgi:predicted TIM-barrel fold metal-dependent hydrolase
MGPRPNSSSKFGRALAPTHKIHLLWIDLKFALCLANQGKNALPARAKRHVHVDEVLGAAYGDFEYGCSRLPEVPARWLMQESVVESLELLAAAGLVFDAFPVNAAQFESAIDVARLLPQLKIVINHFGRTPIPKQGRATQIARAAEHRDVTIKFSIGLDVIMRWRWSTQGICHYSDHVLDLFGPERVMAASNWPVILLGASYEEAWRRIASLVAALSADQQRAVLGETATRIYGL